MIILSPMNVNVYIHVVKKIELYKQLKKIHVIETDS